MLQNNTDNLKFRELHYSYQLYTVTCQDVFHGNRTKSHKQHNCREKNWWKKQKKFAYNKTFINSSV